MGYTDSYLRNIQTTAVDPYFETESNEVRKITRMLTLGQDYILGYDSYLVTKHSDTEIIVSPGHAIKQDIYINIRESLILDIFDISNYVNSNGTVISVPGIYYVVLDYQYAKTLPQPVARVKIAKTYEEANIDQVIYDLDDNYSRTIKRFLLLGFFRVIDDNGDLKIDDNIPSDDGVHHEFNRKVLDFRTISEIANNFSIYTIKDALVRENINADKSKVYVNKGYVIVGNKLVRIDNQEIGSFPPVDFTGHIRYDLITIGQDGIPNIVYGKELDSNTLPFEYAIGDIPGDQILLAVVKISETGSADIRDLDGDILNIRDFFHIHNLLNIGEDKVENYCKVYPTVPATNKINISRGLYLASDNRTFIFFAGRDNYELSPLNDPNKYRYDLICLGDNADVKVFQSQEFATPQTSESLSFDYGNYIPLAIVEVHGNLIEITSNEIVDVRPFLNGTGATVDQLENTTVAYLTECRFKPTDPVSNRVWSEKGGYYYSSNGKNIVKLPENIVSPEFDPISTSGYFRFDLLVGNDEGYLEIIKGEETTYDHPYKMVSDIPDNKIPLAIIRINETENVLIEDHDVFDARPFLKQNVYNYASRGMVNFKIYKTNRPYFFVYDFVFINPRNNVRPMYFVGGNTPTFSPVSQSGYSRFDLVCIGESNSLEIIQGTEIQGGENDSPYDRCPNIPPDKIALFIVRITENSNVVINNDDITCIAEYLNKGVSGTGVSQPSTLIPTYYESRLWAEDNENTGWILTQGNIDTTKPYLIVRDGVVVIPGNGISQIINGNEIYFDDPPKYFTIAFQITADNPDNYGVKFGIKNDWANETEAIWQFGDDVHTYQSVFIGRDGIVLDEGNDLETDNFGYYFQSGNLSDINFDIIPNAFSFLLYIDQAVINNGVSYEEKIDWNQGNITDWEISFNIDETKPYFVVRDGVILEKGNGFDITTGTNGSKIIFDDAPQYFTKILQFN